tara:strand:+ start:340 stop:474 length:135 start_codon:yes stop_codon:yes gene_type:complete
MIFLLFILFILVILYFLGSGSGDNYGKSLKDMKRFTMNEKSDYA